VPVSILHGPSLIVRVLDAHRRIRIPLWYSATFDADARDHKAQRAALWDRKFAPGISSNETSTPVCNLAPHWPRGTVPSVPGSVRSVRYSGLRSEHRIDWASGNCYRWAASLRATTPNGLRPLLVLGAWILAPPSPRTHSSRWLNTTPPTRPRYTASCVRGLPPRTPPSSVDPVSGVGQVVIKRIPTAKRESPDGAHIRRGVQPPRCSRPQKSLFSASRRRAPRATPPEFDASLPDHFDRTTNLPILV